MKKPQEKSLLSRLLDNKLLLLFTVILLAHIFFRVYQMEERTGFRWDQVDNAWAAKGILIDRSYPLLGMQAKGNSGFNIGSAYYYLVALFYWLTDLDPIASGIIALMTSIFTILVLYYVTKRVFSENVALLASFIYAVTAYIIEDDHVQWPVNFIPGVGLLVFYSLYKICTGNVKYALLLAIVLGFSFHIHFTSVFYPIIIILSLPFFPRTKQMLCYILYAVPVFAVWFIPHIIHELGSKGGQAKNLTGYIDTYYHGLHLRRMLQLANDAFIEFGELLFYRQLKFLRFLFYPLFLLLYLHNNLTRERLIVCYLFGIWFLVPWIVFSVYRGEITDYYFVTTRLFSIIIVSYLLVRLFMLKHILPKVAAAVIVILYTVFNVSVFFTAKYEGLSIHRKNARKVIESRGRIDYSPGSPEAYIYYYYNYKAQKDRR